MTKTLTSWLNHVLTRISNMFPTASAFETAAASTANKVTIGGASGSIAGALTSSHFGMWAGIIIGVIGLAVNWYFKIQSDRREKASHEAFLEAMKLRPAGELPQPPHIPGESS